MVNSVIQYNQLPVTILTEHSVEYESKPVGYISVEYL